MIEKAFEQCGDFEACRAAEKWCAEHGISVGINQRGDPRGLMYGDYLIMKWRNINPKQRERLDGRLTGDMRHGPVFLSIKDKPNDYPRAPGIPRRPGEPGAGDSVCLPNLGELNEVEKSRADGIRFA